MRDNERGLITGVCAGLGAYTRIDPIVWRMGFAITGLAGFTGVLLYVGAWMAMRDASRGPAMFEQLLNRRIDDRAVPALLGLGVGVSAALSLIGGVSWGTLVLATPLILGALVAHNRGVDLRRTYRELPGLLKTGEPPPTTPPPEPKPAYFNPAQPWAQAPRGPVDLAVVSDGERGGAGEAAETSTDTNTADRGGSPDGTGHAGQEHGPGGEGPPESADGGEGDDTGGDGLQGYPPSACPRPPGVGATRREQAGSARERRRQRRQDRRARRGVLLLNVAAWLIAAAVVVTLGATSAPFGNALFGPQTGPVFLGSVVVIIGLVAVAGTWVGDPRGLITAGTVATVLLVGSVAVDLPNLRFASIEWRPTTVAAAERPYRLTGGVALLDLTRVPLESGQRIRVDAEVRFGELTVVVPDTARTDVRGRASLGEIRVGDSVRVGTPLDMRKTLEPATPAREPHRGADGAPSDRGSAGAAGPDGEAAPAEPPTFVVDMVSRIGDMEVRRASS
nr:PspC domain-containing protein [Streptomonospora litoralis]